MVQETLEVDDFGIDGGVDEIADRRKPAHVGLLFPSHRLEVGTAVNLGGVQDILAEVFETEGSNELAAGDGRSRVLGAVVHGVKVATVGTHDLDGIGRPTTAEESTTGTGLGGSGRNLRGRPSRRTLASGSSRRSRGGRTEGGSHTGQAEIELSIGRIEASILVVDGDEAIERDPDNDFVVCPVDAFSKELDPYSIPAFLRTRRREDAHGFRTKG